MSEEEVSQQLAQMNQDIYNKKLLKDIDLNFENLIHIFEDSIAIFQKQMDTRIYEVIFDSDSTLTREVINTKTKEFFDKLQEYIKKSLENDKKTRDFNTYSPELFEIVNQKNYLGYVNQISVSSQEFIMLLEQKYQELSSILLENLTENIDDFSNGRLEKLINEIIFNHFIAKSRSDISNTNLLLINNYNANNEYLDNMNQKTVK